MNLLSINHDFFKFVADNADADTRSLLLKMHGKPAITDLDFAITQIECRKKAMRKLSCFISNPHTLFPSVLAYEQASHQSVAMLHATLIPRDSTVLDMTAGLGIDAMAFAKTSKAVTACEYDAGKAEILRYNAGILSLDNVSVLNVDSVGFLRDSAGRYDVIFIDPARRSASSSRVYNLRDCEPDITRIQDLVFSRCGILLIKASPLLDITRTRIDIHHTSAIRAISVMGECKEILAEVSPNSESCLEEAIDLDNQGNINYRFSYVPGDDDLTVNYASADDLNKSEYLYEPGAAVMKLSPWGELSHRYPDLLKLGPSSHLFVSAKRVSDFPGRTLRIDSLIDSKLRKSLKGRPANVVTRNYPLSADELRKKLGVKEGADSFIYGTRLGDTPILISAILSPRC